VFYSEDEVLFESAFGGFVLSGATDACYADATERLDKLLQLSRALRVPESAEVNGGA
jgi:hypothetical protein